MHPVIDCFRPLPKTKKFRLDWREDENGSQGWALASMPHYYTSTEGNLIAHDILEHFNHKPVQGYDLEAELLAYGCIIWGRGFGDYWGSFVPQIGYTNWQFMIGTEIGDMFLQDTGSLDQAPDILVGPFDDEIEPELAAVYAHIRDYLIRNWNDKVWADDEEKTKLETIADIDTYSARLMDWVRLGFFMAGAKYGAAGFDHFHLANFFHGIQYDIDNNFTYGEHGEALMITVHYQSGTHEIRRGHYDDSGRLRYEREYY